MSDNVEVSVNETPVETGDSGGDEREAAKAAVREAVEKAGKEAAESAKANKANDPWMPEGAQRGDKAPKLEEDTESEPEKEADKEEEEFDPAKASVKQILKNREKIAKEKNAAKEEINRERAQLQQQYQQFQAMQHQMAQQRAMLEQERRFLQNLRQNPALAVREAGWDPEQFINDLAMDGTPEGNLRRQQQVLERQIKEMNDWKEAQVRQQQEALKQYESQQAAQFRQHIENRFLSVAMNKEKSPTLNALFSGNEAGLIYQGDLVAQEVRQLTGGREATPEEIAEALEEKFAGALDSWYKSRQSGQVSAQVVSAKPAEVLRGKTVSPNSGGERRSLSPKNLSELDGDERLEAARQAARIAIRASSQE